MKTKVIFPIAFSLILSGFTAYSVLDTLVLEQDYIEVTEDDDFVFPPKNNDNKANDDKPKEDVSGEDKPKEDNPKGDDPKKEDKPEKQPEQETGGTDDKGTYLYKYSADDLKIRITKETIKTKHMTEDKMMDTIVFCADVQITDCSHMRARFAKARNATNPTFGMNITNKTSEIAVDGGAVFAISGDYYGAREKGYVVRNGKTYRENGYKDDREDLVIWADGSFGVFNESTTQLKTITDDERQAWQVFSFGPALVVNSQINVTEDAEVTTFSTLGNQRCSIGVVEPLHYFMAVCDGRLNDSYGMSLYEIATFMKDHGATTAYNLDGGGSATMWYDGKVLNRPNTYGDNDIGERKISDIILFK